jgi:DNA-binding Lrp family transcriptional regulator
MDDLDFRLLAELVREPLASYAALGRKVGITAPAARARLSRLTKAGVLRGFRLLPRAETLGRTLVMWSYPPPRAEPRLETILSTENVVWAVEWHNRSWFVFAYVRAGEDQPPEALDEVMQAKGGARVVGLEDEAPGEARDLVLSPLDWRLIDAMALDPRASAKRLSEQTGLSTKRARTRRALLMTRKAVQIVPDIQYSKFRGAVVFGLRVFLREPLPRRTTVDLLPEGVVIRANARPPSVFYLCRAASVQESAEVERRLRSVPVVQSAEVGFERDRGFATGRMQEWISEKNRAWQRLRRHGIGRSRKSEDTGSQDGRLRPLPERTRC